METAQTRMPRTSRLPTASATGQASRRPAEQRVIPHASFRPGATPRDAGLVHPGRHHRARRTIAAKLRDRPRARTEEAPLTITCSNHTGNSSRMRGAGC